MHNKVDARPHPPGSTCCMLLHAAAEMLGDPARNKGRSSMGLWRSNRANTTHGAAVYCHCGLVYGARVARGCPCNVIRQPVSQGLWSTRGLGGIGRQARGPLIIILTAAWEASWSWDSWMWQAMPYWTRPVVYFGPLLLSSRVEAHMPHAGHIGTILLLSTPSHISNAISRVVRWSASSTDRTSLHYYLPTPTPAAADSILQLLQPSLHTPCRRSPTRHPHPHTT
jgi:hypothetical protein